MEKILFVLIVIFMIYLIGYQDMIVQKYMIRSSKIRSSIKLGVISDLHGTKYGKHQERLINKINEQAPDVLLFVGDIIDERCDSSGIEDLLKGIKQYQSFYVMGNHEVGADKEDEIKELMKKYNVHVISSTQEIIDIKDSKVSFYGIDDHTSYTSMDEFTQDFKRSYQQVDPSIYSIMLSHRPYLIDLYEKSSFDLIVSGHAHGGQWRIPYLLNGLFAPDEWVFPKYAGGLYDLNKTQLLVGRGLVKNLIPRFFNPPELVMIELKNI